MLAKILKTFNCILFTIYPNESENILYPLKYIVKEVFTKDMIEQR